LLLIICDITENRPSINRAIRKEAMEIFPVICIFFVIFERSSCRTRQEECTDCRVFCKKKLYTVNNHAVLRDAT